MSIPGVSQTDAGDATQDVQESQSAPTTAPDQEPQETSASSPADAGTSEEGLAQSGQFEANRLQQQIGETPGAAGTENYAASPSAPEGLNANQQKTWDAAVAAQAKGDHQKALDGFKKIHDDPTVPEKTRGDAAFDMGMEYDALGKNQQAADAYHEAAQNPQLGDEVRKWAADNEEAAKSKPSSPQNKYVMDQADKAFDRGDMKAADKLYGQIYSDQKATGYEHSKAAYNLGVVAMKQGRVDDAVAAWKEVAADPNARAGDRKDAQRNLDLLAKQGKIKPEQDFDP
jgi:hypothetical protein